MVLMQPVYAARRSGAMERIERRVILVGRWLRYCMLIVCLPFKLLFWVMDRHDAKIR